jgi:hypothetical protein
VQLKEVGLWITQTAGGADLGAITMGAQTAQQAGFGSTFERGEQGQSSCPLQLLAETAAGEQQGHRAWGMLWGV